MFGRQLDLSSPLPGSLSQASAKIPRYVRFVDDYPMTVTGKVQKFVMRDTMTSELATIQQNPA